MTVTWEIPRRCPTLNDWHGGPPWKWRELRKTWLLEFPPATVHRALGRRRVTVTRVYPATPGQRRFDPDNLKGGLKPILDALRKRGWLVNDSTKWCDVPEPQQKHGPRHATVVTVTDIDRCPAGCPTEILH